ISSYHGFLRRGSMMKKILFVFWLLFSCISYAGPITKIVILGDSLSDNGNVFKLLFKIIPKCPPYYEGRFTNGPVWAEYFGNYFEHQHYIKYRIYAFAGSTAIYHPPTTKFMAPSNLGLQVKEYIFDTLFHDRSHTL